MYFILIRMLQKKRSELIRMRSPGQQLVKLNDSQIISKTFHPTGTFTKTFHPTAYRHRGDDHVRGHCEGAAVGGGSHAQWRGRPRGGEVCPRGALEKRQPQQTTQSSLLK